MQYRQLYERGKERLEKAGVPDAGTDAGLLLMAVCDTDRSFLFAHPEAEVEAEKEGAFEALLAKREQRIPLQYLLGRQSFMGLDFYVDENVLIPRQDTEILVEEVLRESFDGSRILDICTGSGCILLSLLQYSNHSSGLGLDLSDGALDVARKNAKALGLSERADFLKSDLLKEAEGSFDIIVSNPPYIETDVIETLMPEVRDYEPRMALDGKDNGLYFYEQILRQIRPFVKGGTRLYFEIGSGQGKAVEQLVLDAGFVDTEVIRDYAGLDRVVRGRYPGL